MQTGRQPVVEGCGAHKPRSKVFSVRQNEASQSGGRVPDARCFWSRRNRHRAPQRLGQNGDGSAVRQGLVSALQPISSNQQTHYRRRRGAGWRALTLTGGASRGRVTSPRGVRGTSGSGSGSVRRLSHRPDELQRLRRGPRGAPGLGSRRAARQHRCGEQGQPRGDSRGAWGWSSCWGHGTLGGAGRGAS